MNGSSFGCDHPRVKSLFIEAIDELDAARQFAQIIAREFYGPDGHAATLHDRGGCYQSFIGVDNAEGNGTAGDDVWFSIFPC